jgi:hypothetical protein
MRNLKVHVSGARKSTPIVYYGYGCGTRKNGVTVGSGVLYAVRADSYVMKQ